MEYTSKGLKKFNEEESFDMEQFNNDNMKKIDDLLVCDYVADTLEKLKELYPPTATLLNKRGRVKDTNKVYVVRLIGSTYSWVSNDDRIGTLETKASNLESRTSSLEEKVVVQYVAATVTEMSQKYPASSQYLNKKCLVTSTNTIYKCKVDDGAYSWKEDNGAGGGSGITIVNDKASLPQKEAANMHKLFYAKYEEQFFYLRAINGVGVYQVWSFDEQDTFNIDSTWYNYQHTKDTNKWYKGSRKTTDTAYELIEGTITPSGSYPDDTLVMCYKDLDNYKLYKVVQGLFGEMTNVDVCDGGDISLYSCENNMYYYCTQSKKLKYFDHTDWEEADVINYASAERPPINIHTAGKMYGTLKPELIKIVITTEFEYEWEPLQTEYDVKLVQTMLENSIEQRWLVEEYPSWGYWQPTEERMGKLFYNKGNSVYQFVNRTKVNSQKIATNEPSNSTGDVLVLSNGATYQEGLLANRPSTYSGCSVYYATDVEKYYVVTSNGDGGGLLTTYWAEVKMNKVSYVPSASGENIGYYLLDHTTYKEVYSIYGSYEWVDMVKGKTDKYTTVAIPTTGWTENSDSNGKKYYTIDITVANMYSNYTGTKFVNYVRPTPYSVTLNKTYMSMMNLITDIVSYEGYIKVYAMSVPTTSFQIYLYGL